ncbi:hypothetical protein [Actinoplanes sp. NBRC 103695]|uniref:hypothetical protein n=1 Tax=Actinoplanes sp. NBRC 103695 TaxID=3032202 RepID=UPI0024A201CC|nr:hypothetical protein [Actinoplanes sp. NBRC 103695]GLY99076.1 hypothetical protein Acsp02_63300 [Actinoplanes sp. NBRC 103695]
MRTHRFALAAALGAGALGMTAGGGPAAAAPVTVAEHAAPAHVSSPGGRQRCVNTAENYSIGYPGNWYTTQIRPEEVCNQAHPDRFTIPLESEYPLTALNVRRVTALPSRGGTESERTLLWQRTTVAGRPAVRFETVSTGAGMDLEGTRRYGYVIRLGHALISVHTAAAPGETRYAAWRKVVDRAARTLTPATPPGHRSCAPIRPETSFYEGGRVGSEELTTPVSRCTTISVSHVADPTNPADRCQTFLVGFWPLVDGSLTYTEPVTACGEHRTVLARNVPDNTRYLVLYSVDYIEPDIQQVDFKVWH